MELKTVIAGPLQSKYRLTKQRAAVLRALDKGGHLSAETILRRVRGDLPATSLGTIYRTLEILRALGLVQVFSYDGSAARFERSREKHHHLTCTVCRRVDDVHVDPIAQIATDIARRAGYSEFEYALTIAGRCPECASGAASTVSGRSSNPTGSSA
ncbi:MAG: transcriptional repressor [Candidatus Eremiobacteraeota bacterium]|nr:transcriptional repressor [Candidatus Eremiobacteraeota bacterium]